MTDAAVAALRTAATAGRLLAEMLQRSPGGHPQLETVLARIAEAVAPLTAASLGYAKTERFPPAAVTYSPILELPGVVTIGVFEIGRAAAIPLHDHPSFVVSHLLAGTAEVVGFDLDPADAGGRDLNTFPPCAGRFNGRHVLSLAAAAAAPAGASAPAAPLRQWITRRGGAGGAFPSNIHAVRPEPASSSVRDPWAGTVLMLDVVIPAYEGDRADAVSDAARAGRALPPAADSSVDGLCTYYRVQRLAPPSSSDADGGSSSGSGSSGSASTDGGGGGGDGRLSVTGPVVSSFDYAASLPPGAPLPQRVMLLPQRAGAEAGFECHRNRRILPVAHKLAAAMPSGGGGGGGKK
jgi:hypothetical protein